MPAKMRHYSERATSSLAGIAIFILVLPLTIAMMMLVLLLGIASKATLTRRLRKSNVKGGELHAKTNEAGDEKIPIEGSYTVIDNQSSSYQKH